MASSYRRIEAVTKAGEILKFIASQKFPTTGPDISKAIGIPVGTVMSHLATLSDQGFVRQVGDGWELGMTMALMWARVKSNLEGKRDRIERALQELGE